MSFFFNKADKAPSKPTGELKQGAATLTPVQRKNAPMLTRLGCSACPLRDAPVNTPRMQPTLVPDTQVYFLAEAPDKHEDEATGKPLTGPSGKLLRGCIPPGHEASCSFDNVIRDRPPNNRTPVWQEIEACRGYVTKSIEQAKPKLIVGLGPVPLNWMLNSTDLMGMRGRVFAVQVGNHKCWFLPTYHPSYVVSKAYDKHKPLQGKYGTCFAMDLDRAFRFAGSATVPDIATFPVLCRGIVRFDGTDPRLFSDLMALLALAQKAGIKAVDLETKGLRPYLKGAAIMTAAISFADTHFSFAIEHPKAGWTPDQLMAILEQFEALLVDDTIKVAHNAPFELEWLIWLFGKEVVNHACWHDTMVQAHVLDERRGKAHGTDHRASYQALDFLVKQHFGIGYKAQFKLNKKDMSQSDLGQTLLYNGVDTKQTLKLFHTQNRLLKKAGTYETYLDAVPRQCSVALMQTLGVDVDQAEVKRLQQWLAAGIEAIEFNINDLTVVKQFKRDHKEGFNPASDRDVLSIFKDYLHRPEVLVNPLPNQIHNFGKPSAGKRKDEGGPRYSADKGVLSQIDHPLAALIVDRRNKAKMKSTYVDVLELGVGEQIYPDGKIHCNFNTTFAETGRTSSDGPNMQNFPQRQDSWARKQIVAPEGHVLLAFDYGQLEACTAAMCSRDRVLVKALWEDYDIHMDFAKRVVAVYPQLAADGDMKKCRSLIKNKLVFPAIFGAADASIADYLSMPVEIIGQLMKEFWGTYTGLKRWQDALMKQYYKQGWVATYNGRRHYYPLTRNQVINHPVQGLACEIVCHAMNVLSYQAAQTGDWHIHPRLNIHDDLSFVVPDKDVIIEDSIKRIYEVMLTPPYACVNVPLSVTASVGYDWAGMMEVKKYWSHKDVAEIPVTVIVNDP